jgi:type IV pilus assembly protein PilB
MVPLTARLKLMARLDIAEKRLPQGGQIKIKMKVEDRSRELSFRVSTWPTLWGETIVMRLLDKAQLILDMTRLGFQPHALLQFRNAICRPSGVVLVTGPRQSGKTNTPYCALASLNRPDTHIMTAEDAPDLALPGVSQLQLKALCVPQPRARQVRAVDRGRRERSGGGAQQPRLRLRRLRQRR